MAKYDEFKLINPFADFELTSLTFANHCFCHFFSLFVDN